MRPRHPGGRQSLIVVAGESGNDRGVLKKLIPALYKGTCPRIEEIRDEIKLAAAINQLSPRVEVIRKRALAKAKDCDAELVGIVVHADMDAVADQGYDRVRERVTAQLRAGLPCNTALALAAVEMEGWLMQFPDAFPKVHPGWEMRPQDCRRDLGLLLNPKEHLMKYLGKPTYRESHSPKIMDQAVRHGHVSARPSGNNRSFRDFADELAGWK
ncbi:hypothetical protein [Streptomyces griseosporeus]|uniref:hypothetical protein n=1 Tax=Streptomyces griseosporeus TaxID=1910 RepID=UPI00167EF45E|nr:hypothetical protein [Streptomyces griseosporeus]GHF48297.1 hypothetical protein GCM10018783_17070 [Streptomyces griseosporeus]